MWSRGGDDHQQKTMIKRKQWSPTNEDNQKEVMIINKRWQSQGGRDH